MSQIVESCVSENIKLENNMSLESGTSNASTSNIGLDFILCHFQDPVWPRTVSTAFTNDAQVLVYNEEEAAKKFGSTNPLDCRINAYPAHTQYKGINRQAPNFVFIDLDRCNFTTERAHRLALDRTLKNISYLGAEPTVLWSGKGYHIYLPIDAFILEQIDIFSRFDQPSRKFLRFAARYLSNYKSDPNNNPSFRSCMVRIPGSYNSKSGSIVNIIKKWNGFRPNIRYLLGSFHAWLVDQRIKEQKEQNKRRPPYRNSNCHPNTIQWIERLLLIPIRDYRKLSIWHIFAPYLLNVRALEYDESYSIISKWLDQCDQLNRLDFNPNNRIKVALYSVKDFLPISCNKLKVENEGFYHLLQDNGVLT